MSVSKQINRLITTLTSYTGQIGKPHPQEFHPQNPELLNQIGIRNPLTCHLLLLGLFRSSSVWWRRWCRWTFKTDGNFYPPSGAQTKREGFVIRLVLILHFHPSAGLHMTHSSPSYCHSFITPLFDSLPSCFSGSRSFFFFHFPRLCWLLPSGKQATRA